MDCADCGTENGPLRITSALADTPAMRDVWLSAAPFQFGKAQPQYPDFGTFASSAIASGTLPVHTEYLAPPPAQPAEIERHPEFRQTPAPVAAAGLPEWVPVAAQPAGEDLPAGDIPLPPLPEPGFLPVELHCRSAAGAFCAGVEWGSPAIPLALPGFAVEAAIDRLEDLASQTARKAPGSARAKGPVAVRRPAGSDRTSHLIKALAAGFLLAVFIWFGLGTLRTVPRGPDWSLIAIPSETLRPAPAMTPALPDGRVSSGPVAWVRGVLARRAAMEIGDSFRDGMRAWGSAPKTMPAGWVRHPGGYVSTGQLALFQPSIGFANYRLEFFGQIESKSMAWVVRAQDRKNYYATKIKILEPGLRTIIAIEHYAVVGGKRGHRVEVPLNVMVHNDAPYHVAVEVKGNHFTTSIEGQEVDTWTDERSGLRRSWILQRYRRGRQALLDAPLEKSGFLGQGLRLHLQGFWTRLPDRGAVPARGAGSTEAAVRRRPEPGIDFERAEDGGMEVLTATEPRTAPVPPRVTSIDEAKRHKRASRVVSKAASLKLEGKIEAAVQMLQQEHRCGRAGCRACIPRWGTCNTRCAISRRPRSPTPNWRNGNRGTAPPVSTWVCARAI